MTSKLELDTRLDPRIKTYFSGIDRGAAKPDVVAVSTVPGPRVCSVICGAPVSEIYSVGILSARVVQ
jgi:hypothetical protein